MHEVSLPLIVAGGIVVMVLAGSATSWALIAWRLQRGEDLLPYQPREPVPWTGWHMVALVSAFLLLQVGAGLAMLDLARSDLQPPAGQTAAGSQPAGKSAKAIDDNEPNAHHDEADEHKHVDPAELAAILLANAAVNALMGLATVAVLRFGRAGASWADLGFSLAHLRSDVGIGVLAFLAVSVPVYALNALLTPLMPGEHPIIIFVREAPTASSFVLAACAAVVLAPMVEELLFRVVLQGWLEVNPLAVSNSPASIDSARVPIAWRPIVVSAGVFALLHYSHGAAPVPLFVLALALGFLYQRTHRIWPSLTVHVLLNLASLAALWIASTEEMLK